MTLRSICLFVRFSPFVTRVYNEAKDVDYLLIAKPVVQLTIRRSAASVPPLSGSRLLVVFNLDGDLRPSDAESLSETCEIEG